MVRTDDYEKLGAFYLGRRWDPKARKAGDDLVLYDSRHLVTHAVCVGMTGSGKTGLCVSLLEEAAIDGVPAIVIDPKGDLANLMLTFPELRGADFAPWVDEAEAQRQGLTREQLGDKEAARWKAGLAAWGEDGARIARLRAASDVALYTPGSRAGRPVSILASFSAPPEAVRDDVELLRDRVATAALGLLTLAGALPAEGDPARAREHILLSTILANAWKAGRDLDLAAIVRELQDPPFKKVGVIDLESFFPKKDRFELAMGINNVLAAPGFEAWLEGEPLDVAAFLRDASGRPRTAIFSIAHLGESERMFFVTMLLQQVVGWMRGQPGTSSLRAIVYMDEIFGYFPPVANPPSKRPLLTLLKQARAYGVGVVLATQNPVDLDYKALGNAGTWMIGKLQTERDQDRILAGLAQSANAAVDTDELKQLLGALGSRVFLLHDAAEKGPVLFESRWALSYLRGPMTREELKRLAPAAAGPVAPAAPAVATIVAAEDDRQAGDRPVLPPEIEQVFLPPRKQGTGALRYEPWLLGAADVRFTDAKRGVDTVREVMALVQPAEGAVPIDFARAVVVEVASSELLKAPAPASTFVAPHDVLLRAKSYAAWKKDFVAWLAASQTVTLLRAPSGEVSQPGEPERDFRARLAHGAREARDGEVNALRKKYATKIAALEERIRKAKQAVEREQSEATQAGLSTAVSVGTTILAGLFGRRSTGTTIRGAGAAARSASRAAKQAGDVGRAKDTVATLEQQLADLQSEIDQQAAEVSSAADPLTAPLETIAIKPKKTGITVKVVALGWVP
jgi:hypothetical protein